MPVQPPDAVQLEALLTVQLSVVPPPLATVVGDADSVMDGSEGVTGGTTVTLTDCVADPPAPVQVSAKAEFAVRGPVDALPDVDLLPLQLPEAVHAVALVDDHVSVEPLPEFTVDGAADRLTEGPCGTEGGAITFAVTVWPAVPPDPLHVSVYDVVATSAPVDSVPASSFAPLQPPEASHSEAFDDVQLRLAAAVCCTVSGATSRATLGGAGSGAGAGAGVVGAGEEVGVSAVPPPEQAASNTEAQNAAAFRHTNVLDLSRSAGVGMPRFTFTRFRRGRAHNNRKMLQIIAGLAAQCWVSGSRRCANAHAAHEFADRRVRWYPTLGRALSQKSVFSGATSPPAPTDGRRVKCQ